MITTIITSYKEPHTIGKAISAIASQKLPNNEILVVAPDKETLDAAKKFKKKYHKLRLIQDPGKGKSVALNLAVSKAKGDLLILTDGDVYIGKGSLKPLLSQFNNPKIGAVTGNPVSLNPKSKMFGFWAYLLTNIANDIRKKSVLKQKPFFCSGYLFAIRKRFFPKLQENLLSEDGYISQKVYDSGMKIGYSEKSKVYVKYPINFKDWIKQKKRSAGGYNQIKQLIGVEMRSFKTESLGAFRFFKYVHSLKELLWLGSLFLSRLYLWFLVYLDINIRKKSHKEVWKRVESTK